MPADNERDELAELSELIHMAHLELTTFIYGRERALELVLSSSWLAGKLKQARADALEEAARIALEPTDYLEDAGTCRTIAGRVRQAAST
jgi:hypothetical protein